MTDEPNVTGTEASDREDDPAVTPERAPATDETTGEIEPIEDAQVIDVVDAAIGLAASLMQVKRPPLPALAWHTADLPETRILPDGSVQLLLVRDSDAQQLVRHAGHEAVHVVAGVEERHWAHEMVAETCSLEFVRRQKDPYFLGRARADAARDDYIAPRTNPPVSFAAAYNTGDALLRVMKPSQLYAAARFPASDDGVREWLESLPPKTAAKARAVIETTMRDAAQRAAERASAGASAGALTGASEGASEHASEG